MQAARWNTSGDSEVVNELENKEPGEGSAQIGDTGKQIRVGSKTEG